MNVADRGADIKQFEIALSPQKAHHGTRRGSQVRLEYHTAPEPRQDEQMEYILAPPRIQEGNENANLTP